MNEHSARFEKVKGYYDRCLWNRQMVMNAVGKWITAEEAEEIPDGSLELVVAVCQKYAVFSHIVPP